MAWNPFGVSLEISASGGTVTRKSATQYTVKINAAWETYYSGAKTNYGMTASSGGGSATINTFGNYASSGSGSFTGTYSISGNGSATKTITVTFKNFNSDNGNSATKTVSFNVTVPAWTSYTVKYSANGGSGAPSSQTKWKDQTLTLSNTKPTRTGYTFQGWATSSTATSATYSAGGSYTANAAATLYAVWKANTYTVTYNANGGTNAPSSQTKTYGKTLTLTTAKPTRSGYNFKGWATSATATTITYASGASYTANAKITLYAVWEIAYQKPTVTNFSVNRCDASGNITDEGTYLLFGFNWSCYETITSIVLSWASADGEVTGSHTVTASGTSGTVSEIVGEGTITIEKTFAINAVVTDSQSTTIKRVIGSLKLPFEAVYDEETGEYGISFGKTAELTGIADFAYKIKAAFGEIISSPVYLQENADLDEILDEGHYVIGTTAISATVLNKPLWLADGENATAYIVVGRMGDGLQKFQRYYWCSKTNQLVFQRVYYSGSWGDWAIVGGCTDWEALTISDGFEAYTAGSTEPKYKVNGNVVTIRGSLKPTATVAANDGADVKLCGTLPAQYRPPYGQTFICQGSGRNVWLLTVKRDGNVFVGRYGTTAFIDIPVGAWLTFSVTYSI